MAPALKKVSRSAGSVETDGIAEPGRVLDPDLVEAQGLQRVGRFHRIAGFLPALDAVVEDADLLRAEVPQCEAAEGYALTVDLATQTVTRPDGVLLGLSTDVTYVPDAACEAATRVAVAVADAWGHPTLSRVLGGRDLRALVDCRAVRRARAAPAWRRS